MNEIKQLNIKDAETVEIVSRLADLKGLSLTAVVRTAAREMLEREEQALTREERLKRILQIVDAYNALPDRDTRPADEIIGYDENGLPP